MTKQLILQKKKNYNMRTYACSRCNSLHNVKTPEDTTCKCGHSFSVSTKISDFINMRKTWSRTSKVEFSETTIDEDIKSRGGRI